VLTRLSVERQQTMLALAILQRFNASLCEAVTGYPNGMELLEQLEQANLFIIALDNRREWYRYHQLFADLPLHRLRAMAPEMIPQLHQRAARWFASHGSISEALGHALSAGSSELVQDILEKNWRAMISAGPVEAIRRYMAGFSDDDIESSIRLLLIQATNFCSIGRVLDAARLLDRGEALIDTLTDDPEQDALRLQISVLRALVAINVGDADAAVFHAGYALEKGADYPPGSALYIWQSSRPVLTSILGIGYEIRGEFLRAESIYRSIVTTARQTGDRHSLFTSLVNESRVCIHLGKFSRIREISEEMLSIIDEGLIALEPDAASLPHQKLALYHEERMELEEAARHAEAAYATTPPYMVDRIVELQKGLFDLHMVNGELDAAQRMLSAMEGVSLEGHDPRLERTVRLTRAKFLLARGDVSGAQELCRQGGSNGAAPVEIFLYARTLLASDKAAEAVERIRDVRQRLAANNSPYIPQIYTLVLYAAALGRAGQPDDALDTLAEAITIAAPERTLRPFALDREYIAPLLAQLLKQRRASSLPHDFIEVLCDLCGVETASVPSGRVRSQVIPQAVANELTMREQEILQLMSLGYTNRKIAEKLYVSVNTVKTHASHLFDKLGASNRVDALMRAREAKLLES
jgi:LuxR family maltose regulon positive regulatory protein